MSSGAINVRLEELTVRVEDLEAGGGGGGVTVKDEGSTVHAAATSLDFAGPNVTATAVGAAVTVTVATQTTITGNAGTASALSAGADRTKLDSIASGATAEVDAADGVAGRVNLSDQRMGDGNKEFDSIGVLETSPAAPSAGSRLYAWKKAKVLPALRSATGVSERIQGFMGGKRIVHVQANSNAGGTVAATWDASGTALNNTGTVSTPALATTNIVTQTSRGTVTAASATPTACNLREANTLRYYRGNAAGLGGWYMSVRFALSVISANRRWMCGMGGTTGTYAAANDPSAATNIIMVGQDTADTNIQFLHNDGSGTATKVDTGIAVPTTAELMELHMFALPNGSAVEMYFEKCNGGSSYSASLSTDLPSSTQFLMFHLWNGSGAGLNTQVAVDMATLHIESDF